MKGFVLSLSLATVLASFASAAHLEQKPLHRPAIAPKVALTKAVIAGLENRAAYELLPPVLVELSNLPSRAAVWVEVKKGAGNELSRGLTVRSDFYLRKNGVGVLNVLGLQKACRTEGTWTVSVLMSDAHGTTTLTSTTFVVQS